MAQKLRDFPVLDFSGGLITDKSDYEMKRNEFKNTLNWDVDERGRLMRRRGFMRWGQDGPSDDVDTVIAWQRETLGSRPTTFLLFLDRDASANLIKVESSSLDTAVTTSDTTISPVQFTDFAASGTIEIEGDLISYTSIVGGDFSGVTGIRTSHPVGATIHQSETISTNSSLDTRLGCYSAVINNTLVLNGAGGSFTFDGTTFGAIVDADEPAGLFITNFRDRLYVAGDGAADGSGTRNGSRIRVSFSDAGSATSWDLNNFFDVEDQRGEAISGFRVLNDKLWIYKPTSLFYYDEVELKQTLSGVGAYSHRVIEEIDDLMYAFGPKGIFVTNGFSAKKISDPVEVYLKNFRPMYDIVRDRVVLNTFAWQFEKKYYLYIGDITSPETLNDVVLVYDTVKKNWTVYNGFTDFTNVEVLHNFNDGDNGNGQAVAQLIEGCFGGDNTGTVFRLFENRAVDSQSVSSGGDILADNIDNSAGSAISAVLETPFYDLENPLWWKRFGYIRALTERGEVQISYRLDRGDEITDWIPLGEFNHSSERKKLVMSGGKWADGYRIAFKITSNQIDNVTIFNGFVLEDTEAISKQERRPSYA